MDVLYDQNGHVKYVDINTAKAIVRDIYEFMMERDEFERDPAVMEKVIDADNLINTIRSIREVIPSEIRESAPEKLGLSNKALDVLEDRCRSYAGLMKRR